MSPGKLSQPLFPGVTTDTMVLVEALAIAINVAIAANFMIAFAAA